MKDDKSKLSSPIPEGWKVVPVKPTEEMLLAAEAAAFLHPRGFQKIYTAMLSASPSPPASGWRGIKDRPQDGPAMVELFSGNAPTELPDQYGKMHPVEPHRDYRRELGYWDGEFFREVGTGHGFYERSDRPEYLPTHWRYLPAPPDKKG